MHAGVITGRVRIVDRIATILPAFPYSNMAVVFSQAATLPGGEYSLITNALPGGYTLKSVLAGDADGADTAKGKLKIDGRPIPEILVTLEYRPKSVS